MRRNDTGLSGQRVHGGPVMAREAAPGAGGPGLGEEELEHVRRMRERLLGEIREAGGWIGFERYMEIALYAPGLGYYSAGARKLGPGGRFHHGSGDLAPVRRMPREAVRRGARAARRRLDPRDRRGDRVVGGGSFGAARCPWAGCPSSYLILDVSADLRERQRRTLEERVPHLAGRVQWMETPPASRFDGVDSRERGARRAAGDALSLVRHPLRGTRSGHRARPIRVVAAPCGRRARAHLPLARAAGGWEDGLRLGILRAASGVDPRGHAAHCGAGSRCGSTTGCRAANIICPNAATAP